MPSNFIFASMIVNDSVINIWNHFYQLFAMTLLQNSDGFCIFQVPILK